MSIGGTFWHKICEPLDGYLWHRNIPDRLVRTTLRNQILACGFLLLSGAALFAVFPWLFWFGAGLLCMIWIFWSWARFFLRASIAQYSVAFLRAVLLRFFGRLALMAFLLYLALARAQAPASAILAGLIAGALIALFSYGYNFLILGRQ